MNSRIIINVLGTLLKFLGLAMVLPILVALYYNEAKPALIFAFSAIITILIGLLLERGAKHEIELYHKESIAIVGIGWLALAIFGGIPFIFEGISPLDALFESMAGFTTTGSTILTDIESHSRSILFWRSLTQWLGGMGIIVLALAILPRLAVAGRQLFLAEVPGPAKGKLRPRLRETAEILWGVYVVLSLAEVILLYLSGMPMYDALTTTFSTMATGGFSPKSQSIQAYQSPLIEGIIIMFMFLAGANFALHYKTLYSDRRALVRDKEFQSYTFIIIAATLLVALVLFRHGSTIQDALRYSLFQVVSIITTTGFTSTDFNIWPDSSRLILFMLMFIGGCAGSTGGAIKVVRVVLLLKYARREMTKVIHPKVVKAVRLGENAVPEEILQAVLSFFALYILVFVLSTISLSALGLDMVSSLSAVATTLGNVGPGFNQVGPMANFYGIHPLGKSVLIADMWIGRLEVFTVLVLLLPEFWKK